MGGRGGSSIKRTTSTSTNSGVMRKGTSRISIGGRSYSSTKEIDNYYNQEFKKSADMLGVINAQNKILGTKGGMSMGGKVYTTEKQLKDHYKKQANQAKKMFNNMNNK